MGLTRRQRMVLQEQFHCTDRLVDVFVQGGSQEDGAGERERERERNAGSGTGH
jgi:hypothetical protein